VALSTRMWPLLEQKPECIKDTEPIAKLARSWTAQLSSEALNYNIESRGALQYTNAMVMTSHAEYEGFWIFCDEKGTWVVITYKTPKDSTYAQRNLHKIFKNWGTDVINTIEKTRRYFNESHQSRIDAFKIRKHIIYFGYQKDLLQRTNVKACLLDKKLISSYQAALVSGNQTEIALAHSPPSLPISSESEKENLSLMEAILQDGPMALLSQLKSKAKQLNSDIQELMEAREKCKAERDALNAKGGLAESPEHLEFESKILKVIAYDQEIKRLQAESKSTHAAIESEQKHTVDFAEECDNKYGQSYARWPLGDCSCLLPQAKIFVKSMRDEKDREQFLQEGTSKDMAESAENSDQEETSPLSNWEEKTPLSLKRKVLCTTVDKSSELQENYIFPKDATSQDRTRTRKRISKVYKSMTGETADDDAVKQLFDRKDSEDKCHYHHICGQKKVTTYCNEGGGPCFLIEKGSQSLDYGGESDMDSGTTKNYIVGEVSIMGQDKIVKFCSEYCCLRYRVHPVCKKCHNDDRTQMLHTRKPMRIDDFIINFTCKHCKLPCFSRDPGVWHTPQKDFSFSVMEGCSSSDC
jgi:hypothetical protein